MSKDVECPYCGEWQEICHDDGYGYDESRTYEQECSHCDKTYAFTTSIMFYYEANKADCLNGGDHNWRDSNPGRYWTFRRICMDCGKEEKGPYVPPEEQGS